MTGICGQPPPASKVSAKASTAADQRLPGVAAPCPCGSERAFGECCEPILRDCRSASTAEALMRSRYTAFVCRHSEHLLRSWWPATRPKKVRFNPLQRWLGLQVCERQDGGEADASGEVAFVARYKIAGRARRLQERSRFQRYAGQWYYVDGEPW